ncbi:MAG: zinc ribbon domain-containing protein [Bacteroidaceae bacterium]|nr:zinc ribbon domain-containing protein [Bacteroidaceae bacterium]
MEETKRCPYCGEEILAVAKKCKHCGEWVDQKVEMIACPICGEDNPKGTKVCIHCGEPIEEAPKMIQCPICGEDNPVGTAVCMHCKEPIKPETKSQPSPGASSGDKVEFFKSSTVEGMFPIAVLLYPLIAFVGTYTTNYYWHLVEGNLGMLSAVPFISICGPGIVIWLGFSYSKNFTDPIKSRAALRAWLAIGMTYMWWPFTMLLGWLLTKMSPDIVHSFDSVLNCTYWLMGLASIILWLVLKFKNDIKLTDMMKWFESFTVIGMLLICIALVMQFGPTSFYPFVHL